MKKAFSWKLLVLACVFALLSTLLLKVIDERGRWFNEEPPQASSYPVSIFIEPDDGRGPIIEAIREAKESVDLVCYLFSDGVIIDELIKAHRRGVKVRVMLEREPYGDSPINYRTKKVLEATGVDFKWSRRAFALTHTKAIVIDGAKAVIMTLNLCRSAFKKNREYGVLIEDPGIVGEIERIFEADWKGRGYHLREPNLVVSPQNSRSKLIFLISKARRRIWLQQLLLEDEGIMEALKGAAERGIEIRLLLANPVRVEGNLAAREKLSRFGVEVRFQYRPHLHAKFISFDGEVCFVGSQNLSTTSLDLNRELGILLTDKESILRLEETFLKDWKKAR